MQKWTTVTCDNRDSSLANAVRGAIGEAIRQVSALSSHPVKSPHDSYIVDAVSTIMLRPSTSEQESLFLAVAVVRFPLG